jgi:hypothetical protein
MPPASDLPAFFSMTADFSTLDVRSAHVRRAFWESEYRAASADGDTERAAEAHVAFVG